MPISDWVLQAGSYGCASSVQSAGCAVGSHDEFTFSTYFDAVFFHEPPNPLFPNSQAISPKFSSDSRPTIFAFSGGMHCFDVNQQYGITETIDSHLQTIRNFSPPMFKVTASADIQYFALQYDWPTSFVPFNPGVLHIDSRGKYAVAFLRMSRSIFTLASSVLSRVNSICSALTGLAPAPANCPFAA